MSEIEDLPLSQPVKEAREPTMITKGKYSHRLGLIYDVWSITTIDNTAAAAEPPFFMVELRQSM